MATNKPNSGALFNEEKKSDKPPDYKGSCLVNGEVLYIAAWVNESQKGEKYMSLSFSAPQQDEKYKKADSSSTPKPEFSKPETSDIPF